MHARNRPSPTGERTTAHAGSRLGIRRRIGLSQPTLHGIFKRLDGARFEQCVTRRSEQFLTTYASADGSLEALSLDGKTLRGGVQHGASQSHLLGAVSQRLGVVVAQMAVTDKSHEAGQLEPFLAALVLEGRVVTLDALHTHASVAQAIIARGGDYLLPVKDNQPVLRSHIALVFAHADGLAETITEAQTTDQHGGRIETRRLRASTAWFELEERARPFGINLYPITQMLGDPPLWEITKGGRKVLTESGLTRTKNLTIEARMNYWKRWIDILAPIVSTIISIIALIIAIIALSK